MHTYRKKNNALTISSLLPWIMMQSFGQTQLNTINESDTINKDSFQKSADDVNTTYVDQITRYNTNNINEKYIEVQNILTDNEKTAILMNFAENITSSVENIDPQISKLVDENFWDLV